MLLEQCCTVVSNFFSLADLTISDCDLKVMLIFKIHRYRASCTYRLLNVYRKIFGTSSYGEDARACECISAI